MLEKFFLAPENLYHLLYALPIISGLFIMASFLRRKRLRRVLGNAHRAENDTLIGANPSQSKRVLRCLFLSLAVFCGILCYAKPHWGTQLRAISGSGRDIVFILDLSRSMLCNDIKPSRLDHARAFISRMTSHLKGDRFGLIVFAGDAYKVCPLTFDRLTFDYILSEQFPEYIPLGGTDFSCALQCALNAFSDSTNAQSCALVLISDGGKLTENNRNAADRLKKAGLPLVVVGVGDPATPSPIPLKNNQFVRDGKKEIVKTKLEEELLRELADIAGNKGVYLRSDPLDFNDLAAVEHLKALMPDAQSQSVQEIPVERWPLFAGTAGIFFLIFALLNERKKQKRSKSEFKTLLRLSLFAAGFFLLTNTVFAAEFSDSEYCADPLSDSFIAEDVCNAAVRLMQNGQIDTAQNVFSILYENEKSPEQVKCACAQNLAVIASDNAQKLLNEAKQWVKANTDTAFLLAERAENQLEKAEDFHRFILAKRSHFNFQTILRAQRALEHNRQNARIFKNDLAFMLETFKTAAESARLLHASERESNCIFDPAQRLNAHQKSNIQFQTLNENFRRAGNIAMTYGHANGIMFLVTVSPVLNRIESLIAQSQKSPEPRYDENFSADAKDRTAFHNTPRLHAEKTMRYLRDLLDQSNTEDGDPSGQGGGKPSRSNDPGQDPKGNEGEGQGEGETKKKPKEDGKDTLDFQAIESIINDMAAEERARREEYHKKKRGTLPKPDRDW